MTYYLKIVYIFIGLVISSSILFANMEEPPSSNVSEVGDVKVEISKHTDKLTGFCGFPETS